MPRYKIDLEVFEGNGGAREEDEGRTAPRNFAAEGICSWMYRGDGARSFRVGQRFAYPEDAGSVCPWLLSSLQPFIQALRYGGTLTWTYEGTRYQKVTDPEGITTEYVRCPDPSASGIVVKVIRTPLEE
jgi:uncharacterized repeat protein (TIGR04076 family)